MNRINYFLPVVLVTAVSVIILPHPVYALDYLVHSGDTSIVLYIDPTAGCVLIQILLVGAAGVLALVKVFWRRIFPFKKKKQDDIADSADSPEEKD